MLPWLPYIAVNLPNGVGKVQLKQNIHCPQAPGPQHQVFEYVSIYFILDT